MTSSHIKTKLFGSLIASLSMNADAVLAIGSNSTKNFNNTEANISSFKDKLPQKSSSKYARLDGKRISNSYILFLKFKKQLFGLNPNHEFIAAAIESDYLTPNATSSYTLTTKLFSSFTSDNFFECGEKYFEAESKLPKVFSAKINSKSSKISPLFVIPARGHHSSGFGMRWGRMHRGIDISNATGTPIIAARSGRVVFAGWAHGFGYYVEIQHKDSSRARYAHLSKIAVKQDQRIETAQRIGLMGSSGQSTGPHLHFEIIGSNGEHIDPNLVQRGQIETGNLADNSRNNESSRI